jgi:hypothetical protein
MHFRNDTADQAMCLTRRHPFGDEQPVNIVLLPGESKDVPGIYIVDSSMRALTDDELARATDPNPPVIVEPTEAELAEERGRVMAAAAAQREAETNQVQPQTADVEKGGQDDAGTSPAAAPADPVAAVEPAAEQVMTQPEDAGAPVVGGAAAVGEPAFGGDVAGIGTGADEATSEVTAAAAPSPDSPWSEQGANAERPDAAAQEFERAQSEGMIAEGSPVVVPVDMHSTLGGDSVAEPPPVNNEQVADGATPFEAPATSTEPVPA